MENEYDHIFKILIQGEGETGKTSLLYRYVDDVSVSSYLPTIGIDFKIKNITQKDKKVRLQIWDSAGKESYRTITKSYITGTAAAIYVYSITDENSFTKIREMIEEQKDSFKPGTIKVLVGNKSDDEERKVSSEEGIALANELRMLFFETSAKNDVNVTEMFVASVDELLKGGLS